MPTRPSRSRTSDTSSRTGTSFVKDFPRTFWTSRNFGKRTSRPPRAVSEGGDGETPKAVESVSLGVSRPGAVKIWIDGAGAVLGGQEAETRGGFEAGGGKVTRDGRAP